MGIWTFYCFHGSAISAESQAHPEDPLQISSYSSQLRLLILLHNSRSYYHSQGKVTQDKWLRFTQDDHIPRLNSRSHALVGQSIALAWWSIVLNPPTCALAVGFVVFVRLNCSIQMGII